ncbi:uncharacterized protein LOC142224367 [Haematobia irritans]|uniref:uncharacterized protein LOC142224367 n=1 Tax=Haematobia irritans TaxID=7368 RepID=UPI003F506C14
MAAYLPAVENQGVERRGRQDRSRERQSAVRRQRSTNRGDNHVDWRGRPTSWQYSCGLCQEDHAISSCPRFREKSARQRYETVERRGYCRNCLARSHLAPDCQSLSGCRQCNLRHHTLLHGAPQLEDPLRPAHLFGPPASVVVQPAADALPPVDNAPFRWDLVFVPTAMVRISENDVDRYTTVRALISQSTTMSRIAYSTFRRIGLRSFNYRGQRFTTFRLMPRSTSGTWALRVNALITNELPTRPYSDPIIDDPTRDLATDTLADMDPRSNSPIDLELGADVYPALRRDGHVFTGLGDVHAYQTNLGYVFAGPIRNMPRE